MQWFLCCRCAPKSGPIWQPNLFLPECLLCLVLRLVDPSRRSNKINAGPKADSRQKCRLPKSSSMVKFLRCRALPPGSVPGCKARPYGAKVCCCVRSPVSSSRWRQIRSQGRCGCHSECSPTGDSLFIPAGRSPAKPKLLVACVASVDCVSAQWMSHRPVEQLWFPPCRC